MKQWNDCWFYEEPGPANPQTAARWHSLPCDWQAASTSTSPSQPCEKWGGDDPLLIYVLPRRLAARMCALGLPAAGHSPPSRRFPIIGMFPESSWGQGMADKITKRSEDYSQWYLDILQRAELAENS